MSGIPQPISAPKMSSQYDTSLTTYASNLFDIQPAHLQSLLQGLQAVTTLIDQNTKATSDTKPKMAQGQHSATSSTLSTLAGYSTSGTVDSMYGSKSYGSNAYDSEMYGQLDSSFEAGGGGYYGGQGYSESSNEGGWETSGQNYNDGSSFQEGYGETGGQGYDDSIQVGYGTMGKGFNNPERGQGGSSRGGRGRGRGGNESSGRGAAKRRMPQGSYGGAEEYRDTGYNGNTWGRGRGRGTGGQGSDSSNRGRGRGSKGFGRGDNSSGSGRGSAKRGMPFGGGGQFSNSSARGRGRGSEGSSWGRGRGTDGRGRGSAKRGMPQGAGGSGPAAKKAKWQNDQQGTTGSNEQRWGAEQGWSRDRVWRGNNKEQRGRGRGSRGRPGAGGPPQKFKLGENAVEYGFDGKLAGPERFAKTRGQFKVCEICNITINSVGCANDHYKGKPHLKKLEAHMKKEELKKTVDLSTGKCEVCDVVYTSPQQITSHLAGGRHKRNVEEAKAKAEGRSIPTDDEKKGEAAAAVASGEKQEVPHEKKQEVDTKSKTDAPDVGEKASSNERPGHENVKPPRKRRKPADPDKVPGEIRLFHCDLCNINTTSPELLEAHFLGKKHKLTVQNIERRNRSYTSKADSMFMCELCNIRATDTYTLNLHLVGKKHMKKMEQSKPRKPRPMMQSKSTSQNQADKTPLNPEDEELFETETAMDTPGSSSVPKADADINSSIQQSLQESTAELPPLQF
nr:uncharacterized protein LOC129257856 [Lytechinus pictus]